MDLFDEKNLELKNLWYYPFKKMNSSRRRQRNHETIPCLLVYSCLGACQPHSCPACVSYNNIMNECVQRNENKIYHFALPSATTSYRRKINIFRVNERKNLSQRTWRLFQKERRQIVFTKGIWYKKNSCLTAGVNSYPRPLARFSPEPLYWVSFYDDYAPSLH